MTYRKLFMFVLAILGSLPVATLCQTATTAQNSPSPLGKLVDVGGYRVHLYCMGTGSPAVVIVGAGFSFNWGLVQPEVAKFVTVQGSDPPSEQRGCSNLAAMAAYRFREVTQHVTLLPLAGLGDRE